MPKNLDNVVERFGYYYIYVHGSTAMPGVQELCT